MRSLHDDLPEQRGYNHCIDRASTGLPIEVPDYLVTISFIKPTTVADTPRCTHNGLDGGTLAWPSYTPIPVGRPTNQRLRQVSTPANLP